MKRFLVRPTTSAAASDEDLVQQADKWPCINVSAPEKGTHDSNNRMKLYKNLKYNQEWKAKWKWILYSEQQDGMYYVVRGLHVL